MDTELSPESDWKYAALSLMLMGVTWELVSAYLASSTLPSPQAVMHFVMRESESGELQHHLGMTLGRMSAGFIIAMLAGTVTGMILGRRPIINRMLESLLVLLLNLPALVTILLCYVWLGLNETAALTAVVMNKIPNVVVSIREGARVLDPELLEMARVYQFGRWRTWRHVIMPQMAPFMMAASRNGMALVWKIVLVVELLGRSNGVGYKLNIYFQMFDVTGILGYTLCFVAIIQLIELLVIQPLETRINQWRS